MVVVAGRILVGQLALRHNIRLRSRRVLGGLSTRRGLNTRHQQQQQQMPGGAIDGRRSRADNSRRTSRLQTPDRLLRLRSRNVAIGGGAAARVGTSRQRRSSSNSLQRLIMRRTATRLRIPSRS